MSSKYNFTLKQGTDFSIKLTYKDSGGALIDLTGNTFEGQIRKTASDPTIIKSFTFNVLNQVTNKGEVTMSLTNTETSGIFTNPSSAPERVTTKYAYDVERTDSFGKKSRDLEGVVEVSPEVTK